MATLLKRAFILSISRFANRAIVVLSPLLLVRILSVGDYGAYREFLLYAALITPIVTFGIWSSLIYFVPKYPDREPVWVTQSALCGLATTTIAVIALYLGADIVRANVSFDFVTALQLYVFFYVNLDFVETYWLGRKRTDYVLYFSAVRLVFRTAAVVTVAALTKDVSLVVYSLVIVEAVRFLLILAYVIYKRLLSLELSIETFSRQLSYFVPLGAGAVVEILNMRAGALFISTVMGASALAFYVTGAFATQIVAIVRGAIADVIFPEIVELRHGVPKDALPLWKKATVWYCVMLFPIALFFMIYADAIVTVLFTADYSPAIPVFSVYSTLLILYCFDFHLPLRVLNANRYFMIGSAITTVVNLGLIYPGYKLFGLVGPVVAHILSRLVFAWYLAYKATRLYSVTAREIVLWDEVVKVLIAALVCMPILIAGKFVVDVYIIRGAVFGGLYFLAYLAVLRWLGVWDAFAMLRSAVRKA